MKKVSVAVLGVYGWMGRLHCNVYASLPRLFPDISAEVKLRWVVGNVQDSTRAAAQQLGAERHGVDWQAAIADPDVDLIDICLPDALHFEVCQAALQAGKHVYCEKPFTDTAAEAEVLVALAAAKGVITRVGHNFPINPVHALAKSIIDSGEIGQITMFKGDQHVDSLADPLAPFIWRLDGERARTASWVTRVRTCSASWTTSSGRSTRSWRTAPSCMRNAPMWPEPSMETLREVGREPGRQEP